MPSEKSLSELEKVLSPLDDEARQTVLLEIQESWRMPPMLRETIVGEEDEALTMKFPSLRGEYGQALNFDRVEQMMTTGQIAYPMMLKKAPVISIVRSASGFTVKSADEDLAKFILKNLQHVLPKKIDEMLTFLEYGAYYSEMTYAPIYPQDYGLPESQTPIWGISDFNGCHPKTIEKILRDEKTNAFKGFSQRPIMISDIRPIEVGRDRALIIPNNGVFGNLEGESVLEPVYVWWFWYEMIWRSFLRFLQRAGVGVVVTKAPSRGTVTVNGKQVDNMQWALQMASGLHKTNYAALPSDADRDSGQPLWAIDYLKMGENEGRQFVEALELLGNNIKNFLLTGDKDGADGGEFEVMLDTERILGHIGMYVSEYVLPKILYWNGSKTRFATLDFQGANSRVLPLLFKLMAVAGNTAGDALQNVDWRLLFQKGGVPVLTEEEIEELKKEKEEEMVKQQEIMSKNKQPPDEKAKQQPGGEGRWSSQRDKEGKSEKLEAFEMIAEALDIPIIPLEASRVAELEDLGLRAPDEVYELFNPYHDIKGRFTDRAGAVFTPENVEKGAMYATWTSAITGLGAAGVYGVTKLIKKAKKKKDNDIAIDIGWRDKRWRATYKEIEYKNKKVMAFTFNALAASYAIWNIASLYNSIQYQKKSEEWRKNYKDQYKKQSWSYSSGGGGWPSGATESQFKSMYRDLARAYHPDVSGKDTTEIMQKINAAKEAKNWNEIEKLWKDLGKELEAPSDEMKMAGEEASIFLISAMREAVEDGAEYISFEAEDSDLFPTENGMAFIDANLVKNIYDLTLIAMSKDDEWEEVEMEDGADDSVFFGGEPW